MQYRKLGRTNLDVSLVSLGTGGVNRLGQSQELPRDHAYSLIRHALELGINFFDTSPVYLDSERLLGEALAGVPRDSYLLGTKWQPPRADQPSQPGGLRASLEESLRRMRTDYVDVMMLHAVLPGTYRSVIDTYMAELQQAQKDGLTRFVGITEAYERDPQHEALQLAVKDDLFDVVMVGHNLLTPTAEKTLFPQCRARNVGVLVMCAIRSVISNPELLRNHIAEWKQEGVLPADAVPDEAPLDWVMGPGTPSVSAAAYAFAAEDPAVSSVLTGTANLAHLDENVQAILGPTLPESVSQRIRSTFTPVGRSVQPPPIRMR